MINRRLQRRFGKSARGSVSMLFAGMAIVLFSFIGAAVDYSRWNNARSRTTDALDGALIVAARALQTSRTQEEAIAAAQATFAENARGRLKVQNPNLQLTIAPDGSAIEGLATGQIKTPFMGLMKLPALELSARSRVGFGIGSGSVKGGSDLEISMMLDVTGSMCDDGSGPCANGKKVDALKAAASDLVNIILKNNPTGEAARIALVPFATAVRVGDTGDATTESLMKKVTNLDPSWTGWYKECTNWTGGTSSTTSESWGTGWTCTAEATKHAVNWMLIPCVADRTGPSEFTDDFPGANKWATAASGDRFPVSWDSSDTPVGSSGDGTNPASANYVYDYSPDGICWEVDPKNALMPLSSDKQALLDRINGLIASGATGGATGTQWAWYTLSPTWASAWPAAAAPGSYADTVASGSNPPKLRKIAVIMTDGVYNAYRSWKDQDPIFVSNNAKQICANMKAQGIEIYTVGFDLDALPAADKARAMDTLQTCGTDLQHFYEALDAEQLKQSFRDIAMQLAQIYIAR